MRNQPTHSEMCSLPGNGVVLPVCAPGTGLADPTFSHTSLKSVSVEPRSINTRYFTGWQTLEVALR
jgi:hypothetical protein